MPRKSLQISILALRACRFVGDGDINIRNLVVKRNLKVYARDFGNFGKKLGTFPGRTSKRSSSACISLRIRAIISEYSTHSRPIPRTIFFANVDAY